MISDFQLSGYEVFLRMRCYAIKEKVKGIGFEEFTVIMLANVSKLFKDIVFLLFGKITTKYGLSENVRVSKEESSIFLSLIRGERKRSEIQGNLIKLQTFSRQSFSKG